jgi:hypothetical protein
VLPWPWRHEQCLKIMTSDRDPVSISTTHSNIIKSSFESSFEDSLENYSSQRHSFLHTYMFLRLYYHSLRTSLIQKCHGSCPGGIVRIIIIWDMLVLITRKSLMVTRRYAIQIRHSDIQCERGVGVGVGGCDYYPNITQPAASVLCPCNDRETDASANN